GYIPVLVSHWDSVTGLSRVRGIVAQFVRICSCCCAIRLECGPYLPVRVCYRQAIRFYTAWGCLRCRSETSQRYRLASGASVIVLIVGVHMSVERIAHVIHVSLSVRECRGRSISPGCSPCNRLDPVRQGRKGRRELQDVPRRNNRIVDGPCPDL